MGSRAAQFGNGALLIHLPHHDAAWIDLHERLLELAAYCGKLGDQQSAPRAELQVIKENLRRLAAILEPHVRTNQAGNA